MSMIRRFTIRTLSDVPLVFEDETGKRTTEKFTIRYRSYSQKVLDEMEAIEKAETPDGAGKILIPYSAYLAVMVQSIIDSNGEDLADENGSQLEMSRAFFDSMSISDNASVIWEAIQNDINPQKPSSEPGPSGSVPAVSEG